MTPSRRVSLRDRYELEEGRAYMSGVQALARLVLERRRVDAREGLSTGVFVSGYQGSPLSGFDRTLARERDLLERGHVTHQPGLNEDLAATSVWGTQLVGRLPDPRYDGVLGVWYGKAPGLDRSGDALRHANYAGTDPRGGALAIVGDDPASKSSTIPSASEPTLAGLSMPTFAPGSLHEVLELGAHAIACSRRSGTWSALKIPTSIADGAGTVDLAPLPSPALPAREWSGRPFHHEPRGDLTVPVALELERTLFGVRLPLAADYGTLNGVNRVTRSHPGDWIGIAAPGKTYHEVLQALDDLGLGEEELERAGVRLLKIGMPFPLDRGHVRRFAEGLEEVVVVEDKQPFVETAIRDALYGVGQAPTVVGKEDGAGSPLLPGTGELTADAISPALGERLRRRVTLESIDARLQRLVAPPSGPTALPLVRTPFFCSGCPHNSSTVAADDALVGAGIGCHAMVLLADSGKGNLTGLTQMGGEGAQWIGMAPFTGGEHFVQNLGDGTFQHSGSLAIRAAVAAGVDITYKLLHNEAVAMTGGQDVEGQMDVPALTRWLELEGVARTIVTAEDSSRYRGVRLASNSELRSRDAMLEAQQELAAVEGVTVLIHDQQCAAEKRRMRKRGKLPEAAVKVHINERVCEGCGDCGRKSSCLSVQPVDTDFGRKTQIHQASCNADYSCLEGDCPSFLTVVPGEQARPEPRPVPIDLPEPRPRVASESLRIRMPGIGGTGVVTVSQILGVAAMIDGRHVWGLDQTGLSQKGGPVVSDIRIADAPIEGSNQAGTGSVSVLLGFDLLGAAAADSLARADRERTVAVVSTSAVPTGQMVVDPNERYPELSSALDAIDANARPGEGFYLDAQALSEALFGDHLPSNVLLLGAAYQHGALPIGAAAIEEAIRLNGAAVEENLLAFAWGRAAVADPDLIAAVADPEPEPTPAPAAAAELEPRLPGGDLGELLRRRVGELVAYQDVGYAREYLSFVERVLAREQELDPQTSDVAEAVAVHLYGLMAYKDEYEVARLHLDAAEQARLQSRFGSDARAYWHLHPPLLRGLGLKRKLRLGPWFRGPLRTLHAARRLRGTRLDVFGYARVRRIERELVAEYRDAVGSALALMTADNRQQVAELCRLPDMVRGYEEIKLESVERYREAVERALTELRREAPPAAAGGSRRSAHGDAT